MGKKISTSAGMHAVSAPQSAFGIPIAPTSAPPNFRKIVSKGYVEVPDYDSGRLSNKGDATGSAYATDFKTGRADFRGNFQVPLSYRELLFWAYRSFGQYDTPVLVSGSVYKHTFRLLNPQLAASLPCWTYAINLNESTVSANEIHKFKYRDNRVNSIAFQMPHSQDNPFLNAQIDFIGSGERQPNDVKFYNPNKSAIEEIGQPMIPEGADLKFYTAVNKGGTVITPTCDVYDISLQIANNLNDTMGYEGNCLKFQDDDATKAQIRADLPSTTQEATASFEVYRTPELLASVNFDALQQSNTHMSAEWTFGSGNNKAVFTINDFLVGKIENGNQNDLRTMRIPAELAGDGSVLPLTLEITTDVANAATFVGV